MSEEKRGYIHIDVQEDGALQVDTNLTALGVIITASEVQKMAVTNILKQEAELREEQEQEVDSDE